LTGVEAVEHVAACCVIFTSTTALHGRAATPGDVAEAHALALGKSEDQEG